MKGEQNQSLLNKNRKTKKDKKRKSSHNRKIAPNKNCSQRVSFVTRLICSFKKKSAQNLQQNQSLHPFNNIQTKN